METLPLPPHNSVSRQAYPPKPVDKDLLRQFFAASSFNQPQSNRILFIRMYPSKDYTPPKGYYPQRFVLHGSTSGDQSPIETLGFPALEDLNTYLGRPDAHPECVGYATCQLKTNDKGKLSNLTDCWNGSSIFAIEYDHGTQEEQLAWLNSLGLPMTIVSSGGKSLHGYVETTVVIDEKYASDNLHQNGDWNDNPKTPLSLAREYWEYLRDLLWEAIVRSSGQYPDPNAMKLVQIMRLPGSIHPKTGRVCQVLGDVCRPTLSPSELEAKLKEIIASAPYECEKPWNSANKTERDRAYARIGKKKNVDGVEPPSCWLDVLQDCAKPQPWINARSIVERKVILEECLAVIPRRIPSTGTYDKYFPILCGVARAVGIEEMDWVIETFNRHSPDWTDVTHDKVRGIFDRNDGYNAGTVLNAARNELNDPTWLPPVEVARRSNLRAYQQRTGIDKLNMPKEYLENVFPVAVEKMLTPGSNIRKIRLEEQASMRRLAIDPEGPFLALPESLARRWELDLGSSTVDSADSCNQIKSLSEWRDICDTNRTSNGGAFLLPGFLVRNRLNLLYGGAGDGKTIQALQICLHLIKGLPFGDCQEPPIPLATNQKILYIINDDTEGGPSMILSQARAVFSPDDQILLERHLMIWGQDHDGNGNRIGNNFSFAPNAFNRLRQLLIAGIYPFHVIDSLKRTCSLSPLGVSIYQFDALSGWLRLHMALCKKYESTALWIHHTNKGSRGGLDRAGGSTDIVEVVSSAHGITYMGRDDLGIVTVEWDAQKVRGSERRRFKILTHPDGKTSVEREPHGAKLDNSRSDILTFIALNPECTIDDLIDAHRKSFGESTIRRKVKELVDDGMLLTAKRCAGMGNREKLRYCLSEQCPIQFETL